MSFVSNENYTSLYLLFPVPQKITAAQVAKYSFNILKENALLFGAIGLKMFDNSDKERKKNRIKFTIAQN